MKSACEKNIRPKCGKLCFSVAVLKLSFICIVGSWHRLHGRITSSQCQNQKPLRLLWVSPCNVPRLSWQLQAKFPLRLQGPVSRSLVSLATCQIRRQYPCPSSSRCFHTNNSCRVAHIFCRPPRSYHGMFQGCSIGSIQVVNNNYMYSQSLPHSAPISPRKRKWSGRLVIDSDEE